MNESIINDLFDYAGSAQFSAREKAALRYADLFKQASTSSTKTTKTKSMPTLFCAEVDGVGKFVKSLNVLSWEEACELNPRLSAGSTRRVAAE